MPMNESHCVRPTVLALGLVASGWATEVRAACTVLSSFPATISQAGSYCLDDDFVLDLPGPAPAIMIKADNVVLDLARHRLRNRAQTPESTAAGIVALDRSNVTIRNGTLAGFTSAVQLTGAGSRWSLVEGLHALNHRSNGLIVEGKGSIVRGNRIDQVGGTTLGATVGCGVGVRGTALRVLDNDIIDIQGSPGLTGVGVCVSAVDVQLVGNRLTSVQVGIHFQPGASGKYRDNLTTNVPSPFSGGTDAGNNN